MAGSRTTKKEPDRAVGVPARISYRCYKTIYDIVMFAWKHGSKISNLLNKQGCCVRKSVLTDFVMDEVTLGEIFTKLLLFFTPC